VWRQKASDRELQTLSGHPERLHEWIRAAIEVAARYACGPALSQNRL